MGKHTTDRLKRWKPSASMIPSRRGRKVSLPYFKTEISSDQYHARISSFGVVGLILLFVVDIAKPVVGVRRSRNIQIDYALFERKDGLYEFYGQTNLTTTSGQDMQVVLDSVRGYLKLFPDHATITGHPIQVYQVWGSSFPSGI